MDVTINQVRESSLVSSSRRVLVPSCSLQLQTATDSQGGRRREELLSPHRLTDNHCKAAAVQLHSAPEWPPQATTPRCTCCWTPHPRAPPLGGTLEKVFMASRFQRICSMLAQMGQQAPARRSEVRPERTSTALRPAAALTWGSHRPAAGGGQRWTGDDAAGGLGGPVPQGPHGVTGALVVHGHAVVGRLTHAAVGLAVMAADLLRFPADVLRTERTSGHGGVSACPLEQTRRRDPPVRTEVGV